MRQLLAGVILLFLAIQSYAAKPTGLLTDFTRAQAVIETSRDICLLLDIWLADSRQQQAQGLMFIEQMDEFEGMLFRYRQPAHIAMWMKNTYLSLDMLFIRTDGSIAHIAAKTTALSLTRIVAPEPVTAVLELGSGFTRQWQIRPGNRLLLVDAE